MVWAISYGVIFQTTKRCFIFSGKYDEMGDQIMNEMDCVNETLDEVFVASRWVFFEEVNGPEIIQEGLKQLNVHFRLITLTLRPPIFLKQTYFFTKFFRKLRNTSDGAERVMDTMQQMARSFSTRLVQMGMAYESTVESADNRKILQKLQFYSYHPRPNPFFTFYFDHIC